MKPSLSLPSHLFSLSFAISVPVSARLLCCFVVACSCFFPGDACILWCLVSFIITPPSLLVCLASLYVPPLSSLCNGPKAHVAACLLGNDMLYRVLCVAVCLCAVVSSSLLIRTISPPPPPLSLPLSVLVARRVTTYTHATPCAPK